MEPTTLQTQQQKSQTTTWALDAAHSTAEFTVRHLMIANVRGRIPIKSGLVRLDGGDLRTATIEADLDVGGIDTGVEARDNHLRSTDFFDSAGHPIMRFESERVEPLGGDRYKVHGHLSIRGVSREVALDVEKTGEARDPWGNERIGLEARATIDRRDWGLTWNQALEAGGVMVSDKVKVELALELVRGK